MFKYHAYSHAFMPAGYIDGIGPASKAPRFITSLGVKFLGSYPLRRGATGLGFVDKQRFSTEDAVRIGRIHTYDRGWEAAKLAFISSGGYKSISKQVNARKLALACYVTGSAVATI